MATFPALPRETVPAAAAPHGPKPRSPTSPTTAAARVLTSLPGRPRTGGSDHSCRDVTAETTHTLTHIDVSLWKM